MIEPSCPFGYTEKDIAKIFSDIKVYTLFTRTVEYQSCTGIAAKADRKSKLQHYATVCADNPHGRIWTKAQILEFAIDFALNVEDDEKEPNEN
jgi:hypothetical protein